jgi:hypothetical protein
VLALSLSLFLPALCTTVYVACPPYGHPPYPPSQVVEPGFETNARPDTPIHENLPSSWSGVATVLKIRPARDLTQAPHQGSGQRVEGYL